jgi:hypothetical protein
VDDPNKLKRQKAGEYVSADGRFSVRSDAGRWYLIDSAVTDDLGQELIRGPYSTKEDAQAAMPEARRADIKALKPPALRAAGKPKGKSDAKPKPAPPPSWIDKLPATEARRVRAQIRALEREGISDAETLVKRDRGGLAPAIAQRLIEERLRVLTAELPTKERLAAERLIRRAAAIVSGSGGQQPDDLPGWALVETGADPDPPNRRIILPD